MAETGSDRPELTVGSLLGAPLGFAPSRPETAAPSGPVAASSGDLPPGEAEGEGWTVSGGAVQLGEAPAAFGPEGVEPLDFNNPFGQTMERVWFDGKLVYALDCGRVDVDAERVKVAQEYQIVYAVELDEQGKLKGEPELVPGQYNIYDSVPGMAKYSPIWQFNYVVVPRDYRPNSLRSESDCLTSGHRILRSNVFEN